MGKKSKKKDLVKQVVDGLPMVNQMQQAHKAYCEELGKTIQRPPPNAQFDNKCMHSAPFHPQSNPMEVMSFVQPLHMYIKLCEAQDLEDEYDAFYGFWFMQNAQSGDDDFMKKYFSGPNPRGANMLRSMAVSSLMEIVNNEPITDFDDCFVNARLYAKIATKLDEGAIQVGGGGMDGLGNFIKLIQFNRETKMEEGTDPKLKPYYKALSQITTNQGLVDYLCETTCPCLLPLQKTYKHMCDGCYQFQQESKKLQTCGRCHVAQYCSRPCQVRDWKRQHKHHCGRSVNANKQL